MNERPISRFPVPAIESLPDDVRARIVEVQEKSGFVPNVFLALAHRPDEFREAVHAGGLMSYGASSAANYHRAAYFVDRILKGAKPAELPVEQPTKYDLVVNLKTAKALDVTLPRALLLRADQVIE